MIENESKINTLNQTLASGTPIGGREAIARRCGRGQLQVFNQRFFQPLAEKVGHRLPENVQLNLLKQNLYHLARRENTRGVDL